MNVGWHTADGQEDERFRRSDAIEPSLLGPRVRRAWEIIQEFHGFLWASSCMLLACAVFSWWRGEPLSLPQAGFILLPGLVSEAVAVLVRNSEPPRDRSAGPQLRTREIRRRLVVAASGTAAPDPTSVYELLNRSLDVTAFRPIRALTDRYLLGFLTPTEYHQALRKELREP